MATLDNNWPTLVDVTKRLAPDGSVADVAEILNETNEVLDEMPWIEGNLPTGHRTTIRSGLPEPTWRRLNYGVQPSKSTTVQITDTTGILEAYSYIDKDLAMLNGNTSAFRLSEDTAHIEGMSQELAETLFYGNEGTEPEAFTGFAPRFNDLSAENADNIIDAGGTGSDNTSIWMVVWGEQLCHGIYPKGSTAGLNFSDLGEDTVDDGNSGKYQAFRSHYQWKAGLTVRDWRYIVRIANVDTSNLTKDASGGADIIDLMSQALELPPSLSRGRPVFYCNRTISSYLRRQLVNKVAQSTLAMGEVAGRPVMMFGEVPVRRVDALTNAEAQVT
jgi:hypothetical protein